MPNPCRTTLLGSHMLLAGVLWLAGCGRLDTGGVGGAVAGGGRESATLGTIVAARPVPAPVADAGKDVRATILAAVGSSAGVLTQGHHEPTVEFIIRRADDQTVSVVQSDALQLRPGERVLISRDSRSRLLRAADGT